MQNVFSMMKESFELNGFELNENKKADSLKEALDEVTSQYDEIFSELKESRDQLETVSKALLVEQAFSNLTETQKEKANSLLEGLTFNSSEDFEKGLESIVESVSKKAEKSVDLLNEETQGLKNSNTTDLTKYRGLL
jgi:predicted component of type VI protein secretion system